MHNSEKKLLFIVLPDNINNIKDNISFPYGVLSIASYLKKYANDLVNIKIFDCNLYSTYISELFDELSLYQPDIIGISMIYEHSNKYLNSILITIKSANDQSIVLLGGVAAMCSYREILDIYADIDAICYGEGELPLLDYIRDLNFLSCCWITKESIKLNKTPYKHQIENLDNVVNIDYNLIDVTKYNIYYPIANKLDNIKNKKIMPIITSRGCPFKCVFCCGYSTNVLDHKIRYASIESVISHIKNLVDKYGINTISILDDQLLFNKKRAKELFKKLIPFKLNIICPNGISPSYIDEELVILMKDAGMKVIYLAFESGSSFVLKNLMHKPNTINLSIKAINMLKKYGFKIVGYFVMGLPGETDKHREETLNFIKENSLDHIRLNIAFPFKGSKLYQDCLKNNYKIETNYNDYNLFKCCVTTQQYKAEYITKQIQEMNKEVNNA
jgi:radical SAM superfamily enzyme YgiQ (UPF0313 family)